MDISKFLTLSFQLYNKIMDFHQKQVVWAKVKGYPWWPAYIGKLPEGEQGNYKVIFFAEDTYAFLQPKCVQKFADNYAQYSKTKAKKFLKALQLANNSANNLASRSCVATSIKNSSTNKKKSQKKKQQIDQGNDSEVSEESSQKNSKANNQQESSINNQELEALVENQTEQIDRKKIQKLQVQLSQIISSLQTKVIPSSTAQGTRQWKYSKYFDSFLEDSKLNSEQILHSNLTRKLRFIIETAKGWKIQSKYIEKMEQISTILKKKVIDYLTDTTYYDQHLRVIDRSRQNKAEIQNSIVKIMRKKYQGQIKKEFINIFAAQVGAEVGKNPKFRARQLTFDMKDGLLDNGIRTMNSKAATQRMADQVINVYRE